MRRRRTVAGILSAGLCTCVAVPAAASVGHAQAGAPVVVQSFALSPDGANLAEIVRPLGRAAGVARIVVRGLRGPLGDTRIIYSGGASVSNLQWVSNRRILFVRSGKVSQVVTDDISSGARRILLQRTGGISGIVYDRATGAFVYEYVKRWSWSDRLSVRMTGDMNVMQLTAPRWARPYRTYVRIRLPARGFGAGTARRLQVRSIRDVYRGFPPVLAWRAGRLLAIEPGPLLPFQSRLVDVFSGKQIDRRAPLFREIGMAISPTGRIAVTALRLWRNRPKPICSCGGEMHLDVLGAEGRVHVVAALSANQMVQDISAVWWAGRDRLIVQVQSSSGSRSDDFDGPMRWSLQEVDWRKDRVIKRFYWPNGDLGDGDSQCSLDERRTEAVCVAQTLTSPPRLVQVDLGSGRMRDLGQLNPGQHPLNFRFENVKVRGRFGSASTAFLALPADAGRRSVPLAVMLYGFDEQYSRHAQWITSYPVARFVRSGIAVLLLNWDYVPGLRESYETEKRIKRDTLALIANAEPAVRAAGVRVSRAMVMGWSFGGMFVSYAIQDLHEYVAAQVGDPAAYNTAEFDLAGRSWSRVSDMFFGGPPVRRYMSHYLRFDPAADGRPANGPILLEFVSQNLDAGQYLQEWRAVGTDVEAFAYHRSVHWLSVPAEAAISRIRNLYWAKMNLFGPQSVTCAQLRSVGLTVPAQGWWNRASSAQTKGRLRAKGGAWPGESCRGPHARAPRAGA